MKSSVKALAVLVAGMALTSFGDRLVNEGEKIVMIGDSITMYGVQKNYGYCNLISRALYAIGLRNYEVIGAGSDGDTSGRMKGRFEKDVLSKNPTLCSILVGANDFPVGVTDDAFMANVDTMVQMAKNKGVRVMLITPTGRADKDGPTPALDSYAARLRTYAAENNLILADANKYFRAAVDDPLTATTGTWGLTTTRDGVHLNPLGDRAVARSIIAALGLTDAEIAAVEAAWDSARVVCDYGKLMVSLDQFEALERYSDTMHQEIWNGAGDVFNPGIEEFLANPFVPEKPVTPEPPAGAANDCVGGDIVLSGGVIHIFDNQHNEGRLVDRLRWALEANGSDRQIVTSRDGNLTLAQVAEKFDTVVKPVSGSSKTVSHLIVWVDASTATSEAVAASNIVTKAAAKGVNVVFITAYSTKGEDSPINATLRGLDNGGTVRTVDAYTLLWTDIEERRKTNGSATCIVHNSGYLSGTAIYRIGSALLPCLGFNASAAQRADAYWRSRPDFGMVMVWDDRSIGYGPFDRLNAYAATNDLSLAEVYSACLRLGADRAEQLIPAKNTLVPDANTFSNNFAFVRNEYNVITGTASPGAHITVSRKGASAYEYADATGAFSVAFNPGTKNETTQRATLSDGVNSITFDTTLTDAPPPPPAPVVPGASFLLY